MDSVPQEAPNEQTEIICAALTGDQEAYARLYEIYSRGLYRLCYSLLLDQHDAEDIMQESFVYAFKNLARYDASKASFKTWLYTIAVSRCRNVYRRRRFLLVDISNLLHLNIPVPTHETPEGALAKQNAREAIEEALLSLSPTLREAIVLRYGHGLAYREMAEVMACPQKTAESRVRLAHQRLHKLLKPVGYGLLEELIKI